MMRTEAPKDLAGRGWSNLARTTPELPYRGVSHDARGKGTLALSLHPEHTVGTSDLAPDHADLGAADLLLSTRDIGDLLTEVEAATTVNITLITCTWIGQETYLALSVLSTPSILMRDVLAWVVCLLRW